VGGFNAYASCLHHKVAEWLALFCSMINMQKSQIYLSFCFLIAAIEKLTLLQGCVLLNPNMITVCPYLSNIAKWEKGQKMQL
jgi:hypothetical protein